MGPSGHLTLFLVLLVLGVGLSWLALAARAQAYTAYVADQDSGTVTPFETATGTVGAAIPVGNGPAAVAITPDGATAYITNADDNTITAIDTATNAAVATIPVGADPRGIAITPDGATAYVTNYGSDTVTAIHTATNAVVAAIPVGAGPRGVAITPDGATAYVADFQDNSVTAIDTAINTVVTTISVGNGPQAIAITPDGATAYVVNLGSENVTPIDTTTNAVGTTIPVDDVPVAIAITPDGASAYVPNFNSDDVTWINTASNLVRAEIFAGVYPQGIAITPDGATAYLTNQVFDTVTPLDIATHAVGTAIPVGHNPQGIAITPDQPPAAGFSANAAPAGQSTSFDASTSSDSDGTIARYDWDFGDGHTLPDGGATPTHTYVAVGNFTVTLTLTDEAGCSTAQIFTGQTAFCNGGPSARVQHQLVVAAGQPTLSTAATAAATLGNPISDTATLSGGGAPGGTITFKLYGPDDADCADAPAYTSNAIAVSGNGDYSNSPAFIPSAAGTYRWVASYSGDANNEAIDTSCNDPDESSVVNKAAPTMTTQATSTAPLGQQVSDQATLSGGGAPTGTITFTAYGPDDANCTNSPAYTSNPVTVSGNGNYSNSPAFTPATAGTYRWVASYSGDANNEAVTGACNDANEGSVVNKASTALTTQASGATLGNPISDTATLSGGADPSGTIIFNLYGPDDADCSGSAVFTDTEAVIGNASYDADAFTPTAPGAYRWVASYSGDANNDPVATACDDPAGTVTVAAATGPPPSTGPAPTSPANPGCDRRARLQAKLKRQRRHAELARSERKRAFIKGNIRRTERRLQGISCLVGSH